MKQKHRARAGGARPVPGKLAGLLALAFACPAQAISLNDLAASSAGGMANYWDRHNQLPAVVSLFAPDAQGGSARCTGTLINARTILTAAHCVSGGGVLDGSLANFEIRFNPDAMQRSEHDRQLVGVRGHEIMLVGHRGEEASPDSLAYDLALITLSAPVTGVRPVSLLRDGDSLPTPGASLQIAGYGLANNGSETDLVDDSRRRVAASVLGLVGPINPEQQSGSQLSALTLSAIFRNPLSPGDPDPHGLHQMGIPVPELQGGVMSGDSGGPVFWVRPDGSRVQIGTAIASAGAYGNPTMWTLLSAHTAWLDEHNPLRQVRAAAGEQRWSNAGAWTDQLARHEAPDNRVGNLTRGFGDTGRFYQVGLVAAGRMMVDIDPSIDSLTVAGTATTLALPAQRKLKVIDQAALAAGTIELNGRLETRRFDMSGGVLGGSGILATSHGATVTGGVIAPGGVDIGTLSISGNYHHGGNAVLAVGARDGVSDRLAVSGNATLQGGTLAVMAGKGVYRTDMDYNVLTAASVQGRFDHVRSDLAFLAPTVASGPASVRLRLARNGTSFASVAEPNHRGIAASAETLGPRSALLSALLSSSSTQARQSFGQLSGESLASTTSHAIDHTRTLREAAVTRLRNSAAPTDASAAPTDASAAPTDATSGVNAGEAAGAARSGAWAQTFGTWGRMAAGAGTASMDSSMQGLMGGVDHAFSASTHAGIAASFARGTVSAAERAASSSVDSYEVLLHASHRQGAWRLRGGGGFGINDVVSQRTPSMVGFSDKTSARYRLPVMQAFGEVGYAMQFGGAEVEPFFNLAHVRTRATEFTESGGAAALRGRIEAQQATLTTTGVRANWQLEDTNGGLWNFGSALGWRHAVRNTAPTASTGFIAGGASSTVHGASLSANRLALQLDLARSVGVNGQFGLSYGGEWAARAQDHTLRASWRQKF